MNDMNDMTNMDIPPRTLTVKTGPCTSLTTADLTKMIGSISAAVRRLEHYTETLADSCDHFTNQACPDMAAVHRDLAVIGEVVGCIHGDF